MQLQDVGWPEKFIQIFYFNNLTPEEFEWIFPCEFLETKQQIEERNVCENTLKTPI